MPGGRKKSLQEEDLGGGSAGPQRDQDGMPTSPRRSPRGLAASPAPSQEVGGDPTVAASVAGRSPQPAQPPLQHPPAPLQQQQQQRQEQWPPNLNPATVPAALVTQQAAGPSGSGMLLPAATGPAAIAEPRGGSERTAAAADSHHGDRDERQVQQHAQQQAGHSADVQQQPPAEKEPEETPAEKAARMKREDVILKQAKAIRKSRDVKLPPVWQEPKKGRLHWDALLEEMQWLSKEFAKERKWKIQQSKKYAGAAQRSNMDLESRVIVRQKEEEKALRKRAAWIAKEVSAFWEKARRVVHYKIKTEVDAKKKEVMDKQLDFLLGQTQKYSTMLAERLVGDEAAAVALASSQPQQQQAQQLAAVQQHPQPQQRTAAAAAAAQEQPLLHDQEGRQPKLQGGKVHGEAMPAEGDSSRQRQQAQQDAQQAGSQADSGAGDQPSGSTAVKEEDEEEYRSGQDDDADDEATLEEEEQLAAEEAGGGEAVAAAEQQEAAGLADDADVPLEQLLPPDLLARYGLAGAGVGLKAGAGGSQSDPESGGELADISDGDIAERGTAALLEDDDSPAADLTCKVQQAQRAASPHAGAEAESEDGQLGVSSESETEEGDYVSGQDDDADDEGTLEEEEQLAAEEAGGGEAVAAAEQQEAAGLADDVDVPLEQLLPPEMLARYGLGPSAGKDGSSDAAPAALGSKARSAPRRAAAGAAAAPEDSAGQQQPSRLAEEFAELGDSDDDGGLAGPSEDGTGAGEDDEGDYVSGQDDDADDEATLEEEEQLAAEEAGGGEAVAAAEQLEAAGLAEDVDVPLEQLLPPEMLARYGLAPAAAGASNDKGEAEVEATAAAKMQRQAIEAAQEQAQPQEEIKAEVKQEDGTAQQAQQAQQGQHASTPVAQAKLEFDASDDEEPAPKGIEDAMAAMAGLQPLGNTLATARVMTKAPFLLKGQLREYQQIGLDWLVTLYQKRLNGILADEMGLGKTIQTIALLAHLACERGDWGPHLVVVPTSVMLNWEMEFKKWCPAFKLLTYYGGTKERQAKRQGWSKPNAFHVCITSYTLVLQDARMFKRKKWKYLILDEAHMIKNWKSQRWQTLLNFNSKRRLLITGTPLQNDLMELWSLMHFLMPHALLAAGTPLQNDLMELWSLMHFLMPHALLAAGTPLQNDLMELWSLMHFLMPHALPAAGTPLQNDLMELWSLMHFLMPHALPAAGTPLQNDLMELWSLMHFLMPHALPAAGTPLQNDLMELWSLMHFLMPHALLAAGTPLQNDLMELWSLMHFLMPHALPAAGTPLQNDLMELWSLMHFLMPQVFASHAQFKDWFSNPLTGMVEGSAEMNRAIVERLHAVLRPFLLRRLKKDVEKQLPQKHEHIVFCRLSKRQRQLYEEYMHNVETQSTLSSGNYLGIMNCLMQLRKVCNHPDLFEGRAIVSAYDMDPLRLAAPPEVAYATQPGVFEATDWRQLDLLPVENEDLARWQAATICQLALLQQAFEVPGTRPEEDVQLLFRSADELEAGGVPRQGPGPLLQALPFRPSQAALQAVVASIQEVTTRRRMWRRERTRALGLLSTARAARQPLYGVDLVGAVRVEDRVRQVHLIAAQRGRHLDYPQMLRDLVRLPAQRAVEMEDTVKAFCFVIPKARAAPPALDCSRPDISLVNAALRQAAALQQEYVRRNELLHVAQIRTQLFFPDRRLIQYDCGKLQASTMELAVLLRKLKAGGHKALIFTQMSKMLDILEAFLNLHAYTYLRLDGSTKPEERQILMQRFNTDNKLFVFILSTRSGGVGMNLTGADNVIFYDSDWNPAMDAQAQDRCHRIGQTREVHIWRLVCEKTIEENILKKSDQKRQLDWLAIQSGGFTTDAILTKFDPKAILGIGAANGGTNGAKAPSEAEVAAAMRAAEDEGDAEAALALEKENAADMEEFTKEPPAAAAEGEGDADDGEGERGKTPEPGNAAGGSGSLSAAAAADAAAAAPEAAATREAELMQDVAAMTGGASGTDAIAQLEHVLRPVEKYAVRLLEESGEGGNKEALEKQVEATYKVEELDIDQIEREEEEREADIDEDSEQNLVVDWDQDAADEAYKAQVEAAQREEDERAAAEAAYWANYHAQLAAQLEASAAAQNSLGAAGAALEASIGYGSRGKAGKGSGKGRGIGGYESTDTGVSGGRRGVRVKQEYDDDDYEPDGMAWAAKRQRTTAGGSPRSVVAAAYPQPWELQEASQGGWDYVLCAVVASHLAQDQPLGPDSWQAASDALSAGAAATTMAGSDSAALLGSKRGLQACQRRYSQLVASYRAAVGGSTAAFSATLLAIQAALLQYLSVPSADGSAANGGANGPHGEGQHPPDSQAHTASRGDGQAQRLAGLAAVQQLVQQSASAGHLRAALQRLLATGGPGMDGGGAGEVDPASISRQEAEAVLAAVGRQLGGGATRVISQQLPAVLDASKHGGAEAGHKALLAAFAQPRGPSPAPGPQQQQPSYQQQQQQYQAGPPHSGSMSAATGRAVGAVPPAQQQQQHIAWQQQAHLLQQPRQQQPSLLGQGLPGVHPPGTFAAPNAGSAIPPMASGQPMPQSHGLAQQHGRAEHAQQGIPPYMLQRPPHGPGHGLDNQPMGSAASLPAIAPPRPQGGMTMLQPNSQQPQGQGLPSLLPGPAAAWRPPGNGVMPQASPSTRPGGMPAASLQHHQQQQLPRQVPGKTHAGPLSVAPGQQPQQPGFSGWVYPGFNPAQFGLAGLAPQGQMAQTQQQRAPAPSAMQQQQGGLGTFYFPQQQQQAHQQQLTQAAQQGQPQIPGQLPGFPPGFFASRPQ
ncbi:hypothetical protein N2152v2_000156 [Parachlorella kessleri]